MAHHLQFKFSQPLNAQEVLEYVLLKTKNYEPEHIAVGVLGTKTHVYVEILKPIRLQALSKTFLHFENLRPKFKKYVNNYLKFKKLFSPSPRSVTHFRASFSQNEPTKQQPPPLQPQPQPQPEEEESKFLKAQQHIEELKVSAAQEQTQIEELKATIEQLREENERFKSQQQSNSSLEKNLPQAETRKRGRPQKKHTKKIISSEKLSHQRNTESSRAKKLTSQKPSTPNTTETEIIDPLNKTNKKVKK